MSEKSQELVNLEVDTGPGQSRQVLLSWDRTIQEAQALCHETIALRQYLDNVPGAELPKWVRAAGLRPVLRDGVLCLAKCDKVRDEKPARIHVPVHLRVALIQGLDAGRHAGHFGRKKTLAKLQQRYFWGAMSLRS